MHTIATTPGPAPTAANASPRRPLDRFLGIFTEVRGGEGLTALLLMFNVFLLLAAYYLLKTIREPLILTVPHGAEVKSYSAAAAAALLMLLVPAYSAVASRVSRVKLINGVTLFFIACLVAFFVLSRMNVPIGVPFFIWVSIFSLVVIAQLWAFANDIYTVEQGQRLFAIVGFGASLGAIAGSFVTGQLVTAYGPYPFMIGAALLLALCMVLTNVIHVREQHHRGPGSTAVSAAKEAEASKPVGGKSGFTLVFSDRYLLLIAGLMVLYNLVNTNGEYILGHTVIAMYTKAHAGALAGGLDEKKVIGAFYGNFLTLVNIISAVIQVLMVSRILKWFGVRVALLILPIVAVAGYATMAFIPIMSLIRGVKLAENGIDYSLQNTTRNALYLPTSREAKYKAKQANDTFFVRFGDMLSGGLVFAGTTWFAFAPQHFAMVNVGLTLVWLVLAIAIGRKYRQLTANMPGSPQTPESTSAPESAKPTGPVLTPLPAMTPVPVNALAPGMTPAPPLAPAPAKT